jgi:hypothetical protein
MASKHYIRGSDATQRRGPYILHEITMNITLPGITIPVTQLTAPKSSPLADCC